MIVELVPGALYALECQSIEVVNERSWWEESMLPHLRFIPTNSERDKRLEPLIFLRTEDVWEREGRVNVVCWFLTRLGPCYRNVVPKLWMHLVQESVLCQQ